MELIETVFIMPTTGGLVKLVDFVDRFRLDETFLVSVCSVRKFLLIKLLVGAFGILIRIQNFLLINSYRI